MSWKITVLSIPLGICFLLSLTYVPSEARRLSGRHRWTRPRSPASRSSIGYYHQRPSSHQTRSSPRRREVHGPLRALQLSQAANKRLFRDRHTQDVSCLPVTMCQILYGTVPSHFTDYGYISPEEYNCLYHDGVALCIAEAPASQTSAPPKPPKPPKPTPQLPCVDASQCEVLYGSQPDHWELFGYQTPCPQPSQKRCVVITQTTTSNPWWTSTAKPQTTTNPWWPTTPQPQTTPNPWLPTTPAPQTTTNPWWPTTPKPQTTTNPWWPTTVKPQTTTSAWWTPTSTSKPIAVPSPWWGQDVSSTSKPWWTAGNPYQHSSFGNVQLVGPKPVYVALSHIVGPQVTNHLPGSTVNNYGRGKNKSASSPNGRVPEYYQTIAKGIIAQQAHHEEEHDDSSDNSVNKWWQ